MLSERVIYIHWFHFWSSCYSSRYCNLSSQKKRKKKKCFIKLIKDINNSKEHCFSSRQKFLISGYVYLFLKISSLDLLSYIVFFFYFILALTQAPLPFHLIIAQSFMRRMLLCTPSMGCNNNKQLRIMTPKLLLPFVLNCYHSQRF